MKWTTKAKIQKILANCPGGRSIYYFGQRYAGSLRSLGVKVRLENAFRLIESLRNIGGDIQGCHVVEIGTGWVPVLPLFFWLCGQRRCDTFDVISLLRYRLVSQAAKQVVELVRAKPYDARLRALGKEAVVCERTRRLESFLKSGFRGKRLLEACNIFYQAPTDACNTKLKAGSVDIVFSNLVLGHVPKVVVRNFHKEAFRLLKPNGHMMHMVDLADQFASNDINISKINFLQFPEEEFSRYNSCFCHQNRLQEPEYRQIITESGFEILRWETKMDDRSVRELPHLKINHAFEKFSVQELCTTSICLVARRCSKDKPI